VSAELEQLLGRLVDELADRVASRLASTSPTTPAGEPEPWRLLDVSEAAARLGRSERWVRERAKRGELAHIRLDGGALAFDLDDLRTFARSRRVGPEIDDAGDGRRLSVVGEDWWQA
jgi:hypothetical protein